MKRFIWLSILVAGVAVAGSIKTFSEVQPLSRAAPTSATTGMNTTDILGWRVSVCAETGSTLADAGTVDIYNWNYTSGLWEMNKQLQQNISVNLTTCAGSPCQCEVFPDFEQVARLGSLVLPVTNGVKFTTDKVSDDGGVAADAGTVTVYIQAWRVP